ncbi:MAG: methionyl-tRNA formyltransferase [Pseudomonadota bacterium]
MPEHADYPPLRIAFAGTPDFAALHLKALIDSKHQLIAVYTQPDRPAGRGKMLRASPVAQLAKSAGIDLLQPSTLRSETEQRSLAELGADLLVVVAYGLILPKPILATPELGCLNVHASLLPRWRGAAPIQRAIAAGDKETGITIMQMDAGLDTGPMLASATCPITEQTTAASLHDDLAAIGAPLLLKVLSKLSDYQHNADQQDDAQATYADKIQKAEAELDWQQDAAVLARSIRAFNPFPVCFSHLEGERVKIWEADVIEHSEQTTAPGTILTAGRGGLLVTCGRGRLNIKRMQLAGGKSLATHQMLNARSELFKPGVQFTSSVNRHQ